MIHSCQHLGRHLRILIQWLPHKHQTPKFRAKKQRTREQIPVSMHQVRAIIHSRCTILIHHYLRGRLHSIPISKKSEKFSPVSIDGSTCSCDMCCGKHKCIARSIALPVYSYPPHPYLYSTIDDEADAERRSRPRGGTSPDAITDVDRVDQDTG